MGLNDETPFSFANAIPGLEFHWTSSNIDVCKLKSVYEKVFLSVFKTSSDSVVYKIHLSG